MSSAAPLPSRTRAIVAAALIVPVLLGVSLAAGWLLDARADARLSVQAQVRATVASSVTFVRTDLRNQMTAAQAGSQNGDTLVPAAALGHAAVSPAAAVTARDSGTTALDDRARPPSIIAPIYRDGTVPATTAGRRLLIAAYRVAPLTMQPVLSRLVPTSGGLSVWGPTRAIAENPGRAPAGAITYAVDMDLSGFPGWDVEAWRAAPSIPGSAWFWAFVLVLLGAVCAGVLVRLIRRHAGSAARITALERDRRVVTGLAPVLQSSLDVGEVVPAVSSHLADMLGLSGLSLSTPSEKGERQLFVWGRAPDPAVPPRADRPARLAQGQTYAVALTRGGRVLGVLRVLAGEALGPDRLETLATAGELLGSTLANAEAYARQQDLLEQMRSVDELKTVFLATASHELRTPVTAVVGFTTLLLDQWATMPPERARRLVERVMANGRRLDKLIEQLLDFSSLESGLPQAGDEMLDLGATVERLLGDQPELVGDHRLQVVVESDATVRGSVAAVERIVTNLVGNAAKYAPSGTRITVTVRIDDDLALLVVDDEGPGVAEVDRERIFSRFYRGRGDAVTRTRGAGVGLAIVVDYAASMSGTASVTRAPGGGARFQVMFPAVAVPANVEGKVDAVVS